MFGALSMQARDHDDLIPHLVKKRIWKAVKISSTVVGRYDTISQGICPNTAYTFVHAFEEFGAQAFSLGFVPIRCITDIPLGDLR
jgi:hypothetical protein